MLRRKHRRLQQEAELDITAFMNLMIVLVPVLLINLVFAANGVLDLNFPLGSDSTDTPPEKLQLQVMIYPDELVIADDVGGTITTVAGDSEGGYDFDRLTGIMKQLKARLPDKRDVVLMARPDTSYQTLISVMDKVRAYPAMVAGSLVRAELFPDVSIADAPDRAATTAGETP
jgi:biopolymer transport protein ExbD